MRKLLLASLLLAALTIFVALVTASSRVSPAYSRANADPGSMAIGHAEVGLDNVYQSSIESSDVGITVTVNISGSQRALLIACYPSGQCFRSAAAFSYVPIVELPSPSPTPVHSPTPSPTAEPYSQMMVFAPRDNINIFPLGINAEPRVTLLWWEIHGASKLELEVTGPVAPPTFNDQCVPGNLDTIQAIGYHARQRMLLDNPKGFVQFTVPSTGYYVFTIWVTKNDGTTTSIPRELIVENCYKRYLAQ
jgi:hypothetical protein